MKKTDIFNKVLIDARDSHNKVTLHLKSGISLSGHVSYAGESNVRLMIGKEKAIYILPSEIAAVTVYPEKNK